MIFGLFGKDYPKHSIAKVLEKTTRQFEKEGIDSGVLDARLLLSHVLEVPQEVIVGNPERVLDEQERDRFEIVVRQRLAHKPVSHITGKREFWGLEFIVNEHVLDPRPDSETIIETALKLIPDNEKPLWILDLGTGSGCLLLSLLNEYKQAIGFGWDISKQALAVAQQNAERLMLTHRAQFVLADWEEVVEEGFDLIVSNPPYICRNEISELEPEVSKFEPHLALDGGTDGLNCYRELIPNLPNLLKPGGVVILECGVGQAEDVIKLCNTAGLKDLRTFDDLSKIKRCVAGRKD